MIHTLSMKRAGDIKGSRAACVADRSSLEPHDTVGAIRLKSGGGRGRKIGGPAPSKAVRTVEDFEGALTAMTEERADALLDIASPLTYSQRARLAEIALEHRLPGMFGLTANAEAGGLMSYAADINDCIGALPHTSIKF